MKVHPLIAGAVISAIFALQGWILYEVVGLKVTVATLVERSHSAKEFAAK